jgi:site-specific DNA-methyltransferase (adenine-specific)
MMAYLVEMAVRFVELHRILKATGSLYLHCDPTASHYLKLLLDSVFDVRNFKSEIVWKRTSAHNTAKRFGPVHDVILFYGKSAATSWNPMTQAYTESYLKSHYSNIDTDGRRYRLNDITGSGTRKGPSGQPWRGLDPTTIGRHWMKVPDDLEEMDRQGRIHWPKKGGWPAVKRYLEGGVPMQDVWTDIDPINSQAKERLGWDTQKPLALLERIIEASSKPGDVVLDPFCGCGTAIVASQKLDRRWIGIDITYLSIAVMRARLKDSFGIEVPVVGQPTELEGARQLAQGEDGRYQFQWWALNLIDARPMGGTEKKGSDRGIDGRITFTVGPKGEMGQALVSVKSGKVNSGMVRDLKGTIEREKAEIGLFITLEEPSSEMKLEATTAGVYNSPIDGRDYPRIQILTIRQLLEESEKPALPLLVLAPFQQAERVDEVAPGQESLFGS